MRKISAFTGLAAALLMLSSFISCDKNSQPNIVLVITDDQGYGDLSCHGSPDVETPNIDRLSRQSASLTDFQVSPTCAPTRSAIMTGRHPFENGITHTILERERMALAHITLPEVLKRAGYITGMFGKWHLGDEPEYRPAQRGFDEVFAHGAGGIGQAYRGTCADVPQNSYFDPVIMHNGTFVQTHGFCTDVFFQHALGWIQSQSKSKQPFFAYIATNAPHSPYLAPEDYKKKFIEKGYSVAAQGYYGMIENIDDNMGKLLDQLVQLELSGNTIVIFMSDNGKALSGEQNSISGPTYNAGMRGYKNSVFEGGTRVPFFIRWPGQIAAGKTVEVMLNHYDILPTFAEIARVDISDIQGLDGKSFLPLLKGDEATIGGRYRFFHRGRWPKDSIPDNFKYGNYAVRNERFRYVNISGLHDLIADPGETTDVSDQYPDVVEEMKKAYSDWWEEVRPYMVNETESLDKERPFWVEYEKQKEESGIPEWEKPVLQ
jgi:arylsulfatase A-like enzyme